MMYRKSVIPTRARVLFDPSNKKHMNDYAEFLRMKNWVNGCNYLLEDPYEDIPTMINEKIVHHVLGIR